MNALHGLPIQLSTATEPGGKRWQHVASEGSFAGYRGGKQPFTFTRATFESILKNFRAHPQYGRGGVIPWDYEHASEQTLSVPGVATHGVPATGWVHDLEIRNSTGGAQLWALSAWTPSALQQIKAGEYRWSSVAVNPNYIDPISGKDRGPTLTSIALTNKPFLQGLLPIAASMGSGAHAPAGPQNPASATIAAINASPGNNELERTNAYLCQNDAAHRALPRLQQIPAASRFLADVCQLASAPVKLAMPAEIDLTPKSEVSRVALEEVAKQESTSEYPGFDYASRTLNAISLMPGADMVMKCVAFLDGENPNAEQRPLAERAREAAFYLKALTEAARVK